MSARRTLVALALAFTMFAPLSASAADRAGDRLADRVDAELIGGAMLRAIDSGFQTGSLTFDETRRLYGEMRAIHAAWIDARHQASPQPHYQRVAAMLDATRGAIAELADNGSRQARAR